MAHKSTPGILAQNKKAFADYEILDKLEAGIHLSGPEVKSVRGGHANLKGSYVEISKKGEALTCGIHISPYKHAANQQKDYNPTQKRKLLLHKKEITKLEKELNTEGLTIVPLDFHLFKNLIKLTIGVCRGKKKHDRRDELKKRAQTIDIRRALKER
ncbi:SsrA-binding protein SmpB [Patescibacteria group bacterium]|nr:SsrA-binding protein SmpB [Patescibacteria group bacterium]MBU1954217.1 SsrA-binding protein SmpB [Patescibacteria group bacterium]